MSDSEWSKIDFQQFVNEYGKDIAVTHAPTILYSKKDKEHEAYTSLIIFFFLTGGLLIYIALSYFLFPFFFHLTLFIIVIVVVIVIDVFLIINYQRSNIYIRPLECWFEIYKGKQAGEFEHFCFTYYPIFSGKCHPNAAMNVIYKLYQEEVLKSKVDITQIEVYLKLTSDTKKSSEAIGFFFQYAEGALFKEETPDQMRWKFFPIKKSQDDNFLAIANWEHQYEWKDDLEYDYDKLHEYAPWVIHKWTDLNLKHLTEDFKTEFHWNTRNIDSKPKLTPWQGNLGEQTYQNQKSSETVKIIHEAINKIIGQNTEFSKIKDIKNKIPAIKAYFRDLNL
ncbi:MAG: hypothetical protein ACXAAI_12870 [Promethearchaeota archaeon]|jgi:hypothetical protein